MKLKYMSRIHIRKDVLKVNWLKLHGFVEFSLHLLVILEVLFDVRVDLVQLLLLVLVIGLVNCVSLPTALFLVSKIVLVVDLLILAFNTNAELPTLLPFLEAEAIFLLAVRLLTGAEDEVLHARLIRVNLLEVVHVLAVLLLYEVQNLILLLLPLFAFPLSLQLEPPCLLQVLIFERDAPGTALPYNAYLSWA